MDFFFHKDKTNTTLQLGGKASNLVKLVRHGMNVPPFAVIHADALLKQIPPGTEDPKEFISSFCFEKEWLAPVKEYIFKEENVFVAVRSSGLEEDGERFSFAGQYETELFVSKDQLDDAIRKVWASAYDSRVLSYRMQNGMDQNPGIAVIVQVMVDPEVSGVAFGVDPVNGRNDRYCISSVYGLGEGLVSGELDADTYRLNTKGELLQQELAQKKQQVIQKPQGGTTLASVEEKMIHSSSLDTKQLVEVAKTITKLKSELGYDPDIEFSYQDGSLFLLQVRPVTSVLRTSVKNEKEIVWDNSNIIESYPGLTSPLTFSFIVKMYEAVYRQLSVVMGISQSKVDAHSGIFSNMLGLLKGRVYYNLNSWYGALQLLPGYSLNAGFMEKMMGVKESFDTGIKSERRGWKDYGDIAVAIWKIIGNLQSAEEQRKEFQDYFNGVMKKYQALDLALLSTTELMESYTEFETTLVKKWKAPLVNDFFAMIWFGVLQKQCAALKDPVSHNDLVSGAGDIISTQPVTLSLEIIKTIRSDKRAVKLFLENSPSGIWEELQKGNYPKIQAQVQDYIFRWGDRAVGELKLETLTYHQHPEWYIAILKSYIEQDIAATMNPENTLRQDAEQKAISQLKGSLIRKWLFGYVLRKARYFVSNRENLRYERTRGFGMVRKLFLAIGDRFMEMKSIETSRDIFFLTQLEIFDFIKGTAVTTDLKKLIDLRKEQYKAFEADTLPERIRTNGTVNSRLDQKEQTPLSGTSPDAWKGIGCSAGIVRGKVRIVHHPSEVPGLQGDILVTSSTDPGWVMLFPTCSAILVERGSLLSHSAIVSREMGIPCIVGVSGLLQKLKTGDVVEMDGSTGWINRVG